MRVHRQSVNRLFKYLVRSLCFYLAIAMGAGYLSAMPQALKTGVLEFELERNRYLSTLLLLNDGDINENAVLYASALQAFDMPLTLEKFDLGSKVDIAALDDKSKFRLAQFYINQEDCVDGLKLLKGKALSLDAANQQKRAYYRAKCFIKLGHDELAAQALSKALSGEWAAHAYYNLAMEYLTTSKSKKRALVALKVARELNAQVGGSAAELTHRINLNAGKIYLDSDRSDLAIGFFNEIPLSSRYVTEGLYLHGFSRLVQNDYRAAAQSWQANLKHALIEPGVSESLLALPLSYKESGYQTQALEAYLDASSRFKKELKIVTDIKALIKKYSAREVLIEDSDRAELQWFLNKTGAKNTQRVAYYKFVLQDEEVYRRIKLQQELSSLDAGLKYWAGQLKVFKSALQARKKDVSSFPNLMKKAALEQRLSESKKRFSKLASAHTELKGGEVEGVLSELSSRIETLKAGVGSSNAVITDQFKAIARLETAVKSTQKRSKALLAKLDKDISDLSIERLELLENRLIGHKEFAELGLVNILEGIARARTKRTNVLDGQSE
jgi:hypothetical protein